MGSWQIIAKVSILLINRFIRDPKRQKGCGIFDKKAKFYRGKCDIYRVLKSGIQTSTGGGIVLGMYNINNNGRVR